jgi:hypothetical protein
MKLVTESLNEFRQGQDPYIIMGLGSKSKIVLTTEVWYSEGFDSTNQWRQEWLTEDEFNLNGTIIVNQLQDPPGIPFKFQQSYSNHSFDIGVPLSFSPLEKKWYDQHDMYIPADWINKHRDIWKIFKV